jgi:hypothetical protein
MSYIGTPPSNAFTSLLKQDFTTSVTTGYTLDHAVNNANDIALFINFVRQEPTAAYSASGVTLTLTSATSATDDMYCVYLGQALQTVNPPNASVGASQLASDAVTTAKILDANVTSAKLGTDAKNTPAFLATLSADQSISDNTLTKVQFNTEVFDTNSDYDNATNYRFTPTVAGTYFVYASVWIESGANTNYNRGYALIQKNGTTTLVQNMQDSRDNPTASYTSTPMTMVSMNGTTDYLEVKALIVAQTNTGIVQINGGTGQSSFGAYKIIE